MSYSIRILDKSDNLALLELSKSRNTGSTLFNTDRGTDFFALSEELGETTYFGILKNEQLIGAVGVARQMRMINGSPVPSFYIFDLKVHPDWAGKPPYYRLMQHVVINCREVENRPGVWSQHSYGRAIDINPVQNPTFRALARSTRRMEPDIRTVG